MLVFLSACPYNRCTFASSICPRGGGTEIERLSVPWRAPPNLGGARTAYLWGLGCWHSVSGMKGCQRMKIVTRSADDCYFEDKQTTCQCELKQLEAVRAAKRLFRVSGVCSRTRRANQASDVTDSPLNAPSATARGSCFPVCEAALATTNHLSSSLDGPFGLKRRQLPLSASSLLHFLQFNSHILFCLCISFVLRFAAVLRSREHAYFPNRHCLLKNFGSHQPHSATPDQGSGTLPRQIHHGAGAATTQRRHSPVSSITYRQLGRYCSTLEGWCRSAERKSRELSWRCPRRPRHWHYEFPHCHRRQYHCLFRSNWSLCLASE